MRKIVKQLVLAVSVVAVLGVSALLKDHFSPPKSQRPEPRPVSGPKPAWGWDFSGFDRPIP
ncbi:hypothetical protein [Helicobacter labacensis]|uniref:hypothetical protein n=1 Tax=Helicobacter labacensis TaxID=2316079 RepID=UPI000EAFC697|nr:hypothetical protein [Helicobacter labacensis]